MIKQCPHRPTVGGLAMLLLAGLCTMTPVSAQDRPPQAWLGSANIDSRQLVGQPRTIVWSYVDTGSY